MDIVFMGTPEIAVSCLKALFEAGHNIKAVFTQPDKPKNRGHKLQASPVKEYAIEKGIDVYQPLSLRKGEEGEKAFETLKSVAPECIVVVAYGQILPKNILELPKYGCVNVHASLLPKYRGAAPIQRVIMDGERETGITTMYMAEGLDTGDMILKEAVDITPKMTAGELHDCLAETGARLISETLDRIEKGIAPRTPQTDINTCYAERILKDDCLIDFTNTADALYNRIRGLSPSPCAFTFIDGKRLKVYFAEKLDVKTDMKAGTVIEGEGLCVACGEGALRLVDVQMEGGKRMRDMDLMRGRKIEIGTVLG